MTWYRIGFGFTRHRAARQPKICLKTNDMPELYDSDYTEKERLVKGGKHKSSGPLRRPEESEQQIKYGSRET